MGRSTSLQGGTVDHSDLEKRDIADQHNTTAITGLDTIISDFDDDVDTKKLKVGGFEDRESVTIALDTGTGVFSVTPIGADFTVWSKKAKHVFTEAQTVVVPRIADAYIIYFDQLGTLQVVSFPIPIDETYADTALAGAVSVNVEDALYNQVFDLRYDVGMDPTTRRNFQNHHGTHYIDGFNIGNITVDADGSLDSHTQISITDGTCNISDVFHYSANDTQSLVFPAEILMIYRENSSWKSKAVDALPLIGEGSVSGYDGIRLAYNHRDMATNEGSLIEAGEGRYVNVHFFATPGLDNTVIGVMGLRDYENISNARNGGLNELQMLLANDLFFTFTTVIGTIIYQTSDTYTNTMHARAITTNEGELFVDSRGDKDDILSSGSIVPSFKDDRFHVYNNSNYNMRFDLQHMNQSDGESVVWSPSEFDIDFRTVPQYRLKVKAATPLAAYEEVSLNINGDAQAYPATGGENSSEFTTRNVINSTMAYISSGSGIVMYQEDTTNLIFMRAGTANQVGGVDWGPEIEITGFTGTVHEMNATSMNTTYCAFCFVTTSNYLYAIICTQSSGTITHGGVYSIQTGSVISADIAYNPSQAHLMFTMAYGIYVYSGYTIPSGYNPGGSRSISWFSFTNFPECVKVQLAYNYYDNCIQGITATGDVYWGEAYIRESFGTIYYDDLTNVRLVVSGAQELGGLSAYNNNMFGMVKDAAGNWQSYYAYFSQGSTLNIPVTSGAALVGKKAYTYRSTSGILYIAIVNTADNLEIWESSYNTVNSGYTKVYTSTFDMISATHEKMTALLFEAAHAIMGVGEFTVSNDMFIVDSNITRTDNYIGNAASIVNMGEDVEILVGLPIIAHTGAYSAGDIFYLGPYKYQVISKHQVVVILEEVTPI
ncbi:MAG: hypothetical protein DRQ42_03005 [Gammaproteobacteria bacterium]|nr:MAG: hypothetical protein DRQ42_03005 [Gammaproteobacteria bacterium]